jgi:hypothetical protein
LPHEPRQFRWGTETRGVTRDHVLNTALKAVSRIHSIPELHDERSAGRKRSLFIALGRSRGRLID